MCVCVCVYLKISCSVKGQIPPPPKLTFPAQPVVSVLFLNSNSFALIVLSAGKAMTGGAITLTVFFILLMNCILDTCLC